MCVCTFIIEQPRRVRIYININRIFFSKPVVVHSSRSRSRYGHRRTPSSRSVGRSAGGAGGSRLPAAGRYARDGRRRGTTQTRGGARADSPRVRRPFSTGFFYLFTIHYMTRIFFFFFKTKKKKNIFREDGPRPSAESRSTKMFVCARK